jgi:hypothetical protein
MDPRRRQAQQDNLAVATIGDSSVKCFCCDSLDTKPFGTVRILKMGTKTELIRHDHRVEQELWQCREHYIYCYHTPWVGPDGNQDWDGDEPEYLAYVEELGRRWDDSPSRNVNVN